MLFDFIAQYLKPISILICLDFLLDLLLSCRESPPVLFQFLSILVSFSSDDWEIEHGKFVNCKLSMTDSFGCTYNK